MNEILILSIIFASYEVLKSIMLKTYWNFTTQKNKKPILVAIDLLYFTFLIRLFFSQYWYFGIGIVLVSIITAVKIGRKISKQSELTKEIKTTLLFDNIICVIFLLIIILKEIL